MSCLFCSVRLCVCVGGGGGGGGLGAFSNPQSRKEK